MGAQQLVLPISPQRTASVDSCLCRVLAATALRRYVAGVTSSAMGGAGGGGAGVGAAAGVYAPKEYSKETMPEKVRPFREHTVGGHRGSPLAEADRRRGE